MNDEDRSVPAWEGKNQQPKVGLTWYVTYAPAMGAPSWLSITVRVDDEANRDAAIHIASSMLLSALCEQIKCKDLNAPMKWALTRVMGANQ